MMCSQRWAADLFMLRALYPSHTSYRYSAMLNFSVMPTYTYPAIRYHISSNLASVSLSRGCWRVLPLFESGRRSCRVAELYGLPKRVCTARATDDNINGSNMKCRLSVPLTETRTLEQHRQTRGRNRSLVSFRSAKDREPEKQNRYRLIRILHRIREWIQS